MGVGLIEIPWDFVVSASRRRWRSLEMKQSVCAHMPSSWKGLTTLLTSIVFDSMLLKKHASNACCSKSFC